VVSVDSSGMLEYWTGPRHEYLFPRTVSWQYKTDTDLYEFAKVRIWYRITDVNRMAVAVVKAVILGDLQSVFTEIFMS